MRHRHWLLISASLMTGSAFFVGVPFAQPPGGGAPNEVEEFEATSPEQPLPPGISERVFIHLPRSSRGGSLGTCTATQNDTVNDFGLTGWRLPGAGITWKLNTATIPKTVEVNAALTALTAAFTTWTGADSKEKFLYGGTTSATRPRLDYVNTVLWGKISAGAIAITYVRYYTGTGIIADVDTVFNSRYPWAIFAAGNGECQDTPNAYDVQDIATHEFGHWVGLDDLYSTADQDLTMYGYGAGGELKKRTLGKGDITGANAVAP